ncbi:MAG: LytTR family transcriptional regulator [Coriobacteriales bacterium]|nr:LytTR family transcriptional regulator [Coriobacteriales bacterium]
MATSTNDNSRTGASEALRDEALQQSQEFVQRLLRCDVGWCREHSAEDLMFIGPQLGQYVCSFDDFEQFVRSGKKDSATSATEEEYSVVACGGLVCVVVGRFLVFTASGSQDIYAQWFRVTLVWKRSNDGLLLEHLHISNPEKSEGQTADLPVRTGTETYRYIKSLMKIGSTRKNISLYDVEGTVHWMHPSQVIYLEANRKRTIVHCMTKDVVVPAVIKDVVEMVGPKVVRVHRSYAVNRDHVVELKLGRLLLDDGTTIAIPAKRIADVRAELSMN